MFNPMKESLISKDFDPKALLVAEKFRDNFVKRNKIDESILIDTPEGLKAIEKAITDLGVRLMPGAFDMKKVINELKKLGVIKPPQPKEKEPVVPKFIETEYVQVKGPTQSEIDEDTQKIIQANLTVEKAIGSGRVFRDKKEIDEIHEKALELQKERTLETAEYYYKFAESGVIKDKDGKTARDVVEHDLRLLEERKQGFRNNSKGEVNIEAAKQISDILERGLAYSATKYWYGKNVTIKPTSEFDDVKRGIDEVLEIKQGGETKNLGLGIDITFDDLEGDHFLSKVYNVLNQIKDGYKSKIKYHTDSNGKMMEEFPIPKIILAFDIKEVGEIAHMIRNMDDQSFMQEYKKHPLKFDVMNRIVSACNKLGSFSEEYGNDISLKYSEFVNTIKESVNQNPEMKDVLDPNYEDKFTKQLDKLIQDFKKH